VVDADFELLGAVEEIEPIAVNLSIRERKSLQSRFGGRRWRKLKGVAVVRQELRTGTISPEESMK
jgi:hypothetical protein